MADSWETKFPHPGPAPVVTPPTTFLDPRVHEYNKWVGALRKHNVAKAVDTLVAVEARGTPLTAVETIALTMGVMILDGSVPDGGHLFRGLFG